MSINAPSAVIAVFESRPYWGPELQRQFIQMPVVIRECRTTKDLLPSISGFPSALLVIDLDAGLEDCLAWLGSDLMISADSYPIVACGTDATAELEWLLRDAGVTAFLPDVIPGDDFARLCRRQLGLTRRSFA